MRKGKISESIYKRSVLKHIKTKREEILTGAGIGEDCAVLSFGGDGLTAAAQYSVTDFGIDGIKYAVYAAVNAVAASGAEPVLAEMSALLPEAAEEADIKELAGRLEDACAALHIQAAGNRIEITDAVNRPVITVTAAGWVKREEWISPVNIKPGQDVVVSKWIGLSGTAAIAKRKEKELLERFPYRFIKEAQDFEHYLSVVPEAAVAATSGVCAMHSVTEGGIFGALWEMAEGAGVGLYIDLKKLPVRQETIEVCEFFGISPYELTSGGCLLMTAENGSDLARRLAENGIPAAVAGRTTGGNDRVVVNEEEKRFLEPPKPDEIYKVL